MPRKMPSFCAALLLTLLTSAYAVRETLNSINDVKKSVPQPTNILELLHWFANTVNIDNRGTIQVTFDPDFDFGSHHYGNFDNMLERPSRGYKYYTFGNVHKDLLGGLPSYVTNAMFGTIGWNRGRIIFSATGGNGVWNIDQVYITQHHGISAQNGTSYNPAYTFEITTDLLRQFRGRSISEIQQSITLSPRNNFRNASTILKDQSFTNSLQSRTTDRTFYSANENNYVPPPHLRTTHQTFYSTNENNYIPPPHSRTTHQTFYSTNENNYIPQPHSRTTDEDDFLGKFCIVLAILFILAMLFLGNAVKK
ncbi:PREDICTED: uncharacterized protein LOC107103326 isoform X3 [Cyprinodon variegatus]|uniref:uncharacterized protein LOC107103326 isoform X3 n=1 Tax=Cyprinodon variegatus TaxID=28743 RepID=UPI0007426F73|nr:PREDICTED: uncharacterized protein LOC107103326 isoform X3 [Cyprinodon variegatus]